MEARSSLAAWLDGPLVPTLCFSDTHLVPRTLPWADDAPDDLLALIDAYPSHRLLALGDLTEAIGLREADRALFASSERLETLFGRIAARDHRIVVGNHDATSASFLRQRFGDENVFAGGFDIGRVRVRHGHEGRPLHTWLESRLGPAVVPWFERQRRGKPPERLGNEAVLGSIRGGAPFVLFGHTHRAMLGQHAANPGCFLRSAQSFLTIDGDEIALFRKTA